MRHLPAWPSWDPLPDHCCQARFTQTRWPGPSQGHVWTSGSSGAGRDHSSPFLGLDHLTAPTLSGSHAQVSLEGVSLEGRVNAGDRGLQRVIGTDGLWILDLLYGMPQMAGRVIFRNSPIKTKVGCLRPPRASSTTRWLMQGGFCNSQGGP